VANLNTSARRDGDFFVVNGQKKFISGAMYADYFTVAVRTGEKGMGGISLLLVEKKYARNSREATQDPRVVDLQYMPRDI